MKHLYVIEATSLHETTVKGGEKMQITKLDYPVCGKKKYRVIHNDKEYTCYLVPFGDNLVVTGDGNSENFKDITMTKLGTRIIIECHKAD